MNKFYAALTMTLGFVASAMAQSLSLAPAGDRILNRPLPLAPAELSATPLHRVDDNHTWTSIGTGQFIDGFVTSLNSALQAGPWDVEIEQCVENPALYRMVDPYGPSWGYYSDGAYTVRPDETTYVEFDTTDPDAVTISNLNSQNLLPLNVQINDKYGEFAIYNYANSATGTLADNVITFNESTLFTYLVAYQSILEANDFKVYLPGAKDYSVQIADNELCTDDNVFSFTVTAGADAASLKMGIYPGQFAVSQTNNDVIAAQGATIEAGKQSVTLDNLEHGWYTIYVVSLDADGNAKEGVVARQFAIVHNPDEWTSLGMCNFTDDTFAAIFGISSTLPSYQVEILESNTTPGLYRMVDPYVSNPVILSYPEYLHKTHSHYVDINATNPEAVKIISSPMGVQVGAYDAMWLYYNQTGTLESHNITFPLNGLVVYMGDGGYYANKLGAFNIELPHFSATVNVTDGINPIEGASVYVRGEEMEPVVTDADGNAAINLDHALTAGTHSIVAYIDGYDGEAATIEVTDGIFAYETSVTLTQAVCTLEINVYNTDNEPIAEAGVTINGEMQTGLTDENGYASYSLTGVFGTELAVSVSKTGYITYETTVTFTDTYTRRIIVTLDSEDSGLNEISTGSTDSGSIFDMTGRRLKRVSSPGIYIIGGKPTLIR